MARALPAEGHGGSASATGSSAWQPEGRRVERREDSGGTTIHSESVHSLPPPVYSDCVVQHQRKGAERRVRVSGGKPEI